MAECERNHCLLIVAQALELKHPIGTGDENFAPDGVVYRIPPWASTEG